MKRPGYATKYFRQLGWIAARDGLSLTHRRQERLAWPTFARRAWADGWFSYTPPGKGTRRTR